LEFFYNALQSFGQTANSLTLERLLKQLNFILKYCVAG